jgi:hypothetical protein
MSASGQELPVRRPGVKVAMLVGERQRSLARSQAASWWNGWLGGFMF